MPGSIPPSRVVTTEYGQVQGRRLVHEGDKQVDAFQGIPFAAPPVGELRFKKPVPPSPWDGVRETKAFPARSISTPMDPSENHLKGEPSEDCLYLNVFTPCWEAPEGGFPVMVFIHGGAFVFGDTFSYGDIGICENVVPRGIVSITIQYRVGYLGFFTTGDSACPGNFGLWDQVEALKWVQNNIGAFGGNKENVTVLGQSAGSASVDLLHLSPHSTNLFHKGICMAGTAECRWSIHPDMRHQSLGMAKRLEVGEFSSSEDLITKLRQVPAEKFAISMFTPIKEDNVDLETCPCLDGDLFPSSLESLRAKATPKPFLTGVTKEEGLLMVLGRESTEKALEETLNETTRDVSKKEEMKAELRRRFVGDAKPGDSAYLRGIVGMVSDYFFDAGTLDFCRKTVTLQKDPVFLYVLEHYNPSSMGILGGMMPYQEATHTNEIFYLFKKGLFNDQELTEEERRIMDTYTTACTNFAKFGNPNGSDPSHTDLPSRWDRITKDNPSLNYVIPTGEPRMNREFFAVSSLIFVDGPFNPKLIFELSGKNRRLH
ncbi:hypothetical protein PMAYCL1PPCAC_22208, partial [Pristionchus mayeri]